MHKYEYAIVYERKDGKYDFKVVAGENGNTLCNSDQGYEQQYDALIALHRVTGRSAVKVTEVKSIPTRTTIQVVFEKEDT